MKKILVLLAALGLLAGAASATTLTFTAGSTSTFLHVQTAATGLGADSGATTSGIVIIDLFANGMVAGQSITMRSSGDICYTNTGCTAASGQVAIGLVGVFVAVGSTPSVSANSGSSTSGVNAARITAILSTLPHYTPVNSFDGEVTDIPGLFKVATSTVAFTGTTVNIPTGAQYLVLAIEDSRYSDNSDPDNNARAFVDFTAAEGVPEPASIGMIGAGLIALGALARRRK